MFRDSSGESVRSAEIAVNSACVHSCECELGASRVLLTSDKTFGRLYIYSSVKSGEPRLQRKGSAFNCLRCSRRSVTILTASLTPFGRPYRVVGRPAGRMERDQP